MNTVTFTTASAVESILSSATFVPPVPPVAVVGPVAELRADMARFSSGVAHVRRRSAVEKAIDLTAGFDFRAEAARRTASRLVGPRISAIEELALVVPTEVLGCALLVDEADLAQLRIDICAVVEVIGRQRVVTAEADAATMRLRRMFDQHPSGPVAPISLLYQNHDATAALLASEIYAHHLKIARRSAISRTARVAVARTIIDGVDVASGTAVTLDLESSGLEFGAGPHHCPGQRIAEEIVAGMSAAISASGYVIANEEIELHPDGRPKAIPLCAEC